MRITFTDEEALDMYYNALCNGLGYIGYYGLSIDCDREAYNEARAKLESPCLEDVFIQVLKDGGTLQFIDEEYDGEYSRDVTLQMVLDNISKTPTKHLMDMVNEQDDAITADVILQSVMYGEVIFG